MSVLKVRQVLTVLVPGVLTVLVLKVLKVPVDVQVRQRSVRKRLKNLPTSYAKTTSVRR